MVQHDEYEMKMSAVALDSELSPYSFIIQMSKALDEGELQLWEDEDQQSFYERLMDLRRILPSRKVR